MQFVGRERADAPHLVLGAAGGDVDPLPVRFFGHRPDAPAFAGGDDQGQEHDVPFVALEVVGVAAADPPPFHLLLAERLDELALDQFGLPVTEQGDDAEGLAVVARVGAQLGDLADDVVGFGRVGVGAGFPVAVGNVDVDDALPGRVGGLFAQRQDCAAVGELVGELDDFRQAAEVLAEHDDARETASSTSHTGWS